MEPTQLGLDEPATPIALVLARGTLGTTSLCGG